VLLVQGWSSVIPRFSAVDFVSFYIEIPVMIVMYLAWLSLTQISRRKVKVNSTENEDVAESSLSAGVPKSTRWFDIVDTAKVDLYHDEYQDEVLDQIDDQKREYRLSGKSRWFWQLYYIVA
jgi:amino acid transporter, AAT family